VIRWIGKVLRFGDHAAIWRAARPQAPSATAVWFVRRFLSASSIVTRRWGPRWATRHSSFGYDAGTWILAIIWMGLPLVCFLVTGWRLFW
jgi:hypothetical protein